MMDRDQLKTSEPKCGILHHKKQLIRGQLMNGGRVV